MKLHPATQILTWCVLVAAMQFLPPAYLLMAGGIVLLSAFALSRHKFLQLVRRTRWIMFSLWLIYAYSTPGQPVYAAFAPFSPSFEGLTDGGLQLMRLLAALAGLAILLDRLHRQQLMAGLYSLFAPLKWLGVSRERLAVRLALTLHYAEVAMLRTQSWQESLRSLFEPHMEATRELELPVYRFALADVLMMTGSVLLLWQVVI
ncbi:MAG: CbiQ family ECF transporter T component [Gallionella sp.]|nr:CbiQ family ECF transporter T component [Gallionella sp.]